MSEDSEAGFEALHSIGRGTTVLIAGTVLLFLLSFIGRVYTARYLSVSDFGAFNLSLALTGLLSLVALLGLHQATARSIANTPDPAVRQRIVRFATGMTAVAAIVTSSLVFFLAGPLAVLFGSSPDGPLAESFELMSVTIGLTLGCTLLASIFQGLENALPNAVFNQIVQPAGFVVFVFLFFHFHWAFIGAIWAWTLSNVVAFAAILLYSLRRLPAVLQPTTDVTAALPPRLFSLSLALWGVTTLTFVTAYFDTLVLGVFRPESAVGVYSAALTLGRLLLAANAALTYIYLPVAARLERQGRIDAVRSTFVTSTRWILLITVPLFLLFVALPGQSISAVYGSAYVSGALALSIVAWGSLISVAVGPVNSALAGLGMSSWLLLTTALSATTDIGLSFGLIPTFGLLGAAIAWTVARVVYPVSGSLGLYLAYRVTPATRALLFPLGITIGIGLPLFWLLGYWGAPAWIVFPLYPVGVGLYLLATVVTRSFEPGDVVLCRFLERLLRRPMPALERYLTLHSMSSAPPSSPGPGPLS